MSKSLMAYGAELVVDSRLASPTVQSMPRYGMPASLLQPYRVVIGSSSVFTKQVYDLEHSGRPFCMMEHTRAARLGAAAMLFIDAIDDFVDAGEKRPDERQDAFRRALGHVALGECSCESECTAPFAAATALYTTAVSHSPGMQQSMIELFEAGIEQISSRDEQRQLELSSVIGAMCSRVEYDAVELVTNRQGSANVKKAVDRIGSYSYMLDLAYEIDEDLDDESLNYATLVIANHGDDPLVRKELQSNLFDAAQDEYTRGKAELDTRQQRQLYRTMRQTIEVKYKIKRFAPWLLKGTSTWGKEGSKPTCVS